MGIGKQEDGTGKADRGIEGGESYLMQEISDKLILGKRVQILHGCIYYRITLVWLLMNISTYITFMNQAKCIIIFFCGYMQIAENT